MLMEQISYHNVRILNLNTRVLILMQIINLTDKYLIEHVFIVNLI